MCSIILYLLISNRRSGTAITLMTRNDWRQAKPLIEIMVEAGQVGLWSYALRIHILYIELVEFTHALIHTYLVNLRGSNKLEIVALNNWL